MINLSAFYIFLENSEVVVDSLSLELVFKCLSACSSKLKNYCSNYDILNILAKLTFPFWPSHHHRNNVSFLIVFWDLKQSTCSPHILLPQVCVSLNTVCWLKTHVFFISVQAANDSVCRLQQREQERKKVKDHLDNGTYKSWVFVILLAIAFDQKILWMQWFLHIFKWLIHWRCVEEVWSRGHTINIFINWNCRTLFFPFQHFHLFPESGICLLEERENRTFTCNNKYPPDWRYKSFLWAWSIEYIMYISSRKGSIHACG